MSKILKVIRKQFSPRQKEWPKGLSKSSHTHSFSYAQTTPYWESVGVIPSFIGSTNLPSKSTTTYSRIRKR